MEKHAFPSGFAGGLATGGPCYDGARFQPDFPHFIWFWVDLLHDDHGISLRITLFLPQDQQAHATGHKHDRIAARFGESMARVDLFSPSLVGWDSALALGDHVGLWIVAILSCRATE